LGLIYDLTYKGPTTYRNGRLLEFQDYLLQELALLLIRSSRDSSTEQFKIIGDALGQIDEQYVRYNGMALPTLFLLKMSNHLRGVLVGKNKEFNDILEEGSGFEYSDVDRDPGLMAALKSENAQRFGDILELSEFRKILDNPEKQAHDNVRFKGDDIEAVNSSRDTVLCVASLVMTDPETYVMPSSYWPTPNIPGIMWTYNNNGIDLYVDRITGDLYFPASSVSIHPSLIKSEGTYEQMKNVIFRKLQDYLRKKEPDVEDCWIAQAVSESESSMETCEELSGAVAEEVSEVEPSVVDGDEVPTGTFRTKSSVKLTGLKGITGDRFVTILTRILGRGPDRTHGGSHYVFKGYNGKSCPVPIHGKKSLPLFVIRNAIRTLEISQEELTAAL
jgi:hypothetical protein